MQIGVVTTLETNVGDDFIRNGLKRAIRAAGIDADYVSVNKHCIHEILLRRHPARWTACLPRGRFRLANMVMRISGHPEWNVFSACDVVIQCGTPVFWPQAYSVPWHYIAWERVLPWLADRMPVLNLGAGSCYPWDGQPHVVMDDRDRKHARHVLATATVTTVRDGVAADLAAEFGFSPSLLPCPSILAPDDPVLWSGSSAGPLYINYMPGGGHVFWDEGASRDDWHRTVRDVAKAMSRQRSVIFLCHSEAEEVAAAHYFPDYPRVRPRTVTEYFETISGAAACICNRMHACMAFRALGIPAIAVGRDTRILMARHVDATCLYTDTTDATTLLGAVEDALSATDALLLRMQRMRESTLNSYAAVIGEEVVP